MLEQSLVDSFCQADTPSCGFYADRPTPGTPASHSSEAALLQQIFPQRKEFNTKINKRIAGAPIIVWFDASQTKCVCAFACFTKCEACASPAVVHSRVLQPCSKQTQHCKCRTCLLPGHRTALSHGYDCFYQRAFRAHAQVMQAEMPLLRRLPSQRAGEVGLCMDTLGRSRHGGGSA